MDRRRFIASLAALSSAIALDPERLLWVPRPMITVPGGPMKLWGDGFHDDTIALQAWMDAHGPATLPLGSYYCTGPITIGFDKLIHDSHLRWHSDRTIDRLLTLPSDCNSTLVRCHIDGTETHANVAIYAESQNKAALHGNIWGTHGSFGR